MNDKRAERRQENVYPNKDISIIPENSMRTPCRSSMLRALCSLLSFTSTLLCPSDFASSDIFIQFLAIDQDILH